MQWNPKGSCTKLVTLAYFKFRGYERSILRCYDYKSKARWVQRICDNYNVTCICTFKLVSAIERLELTVDFGCIYVVTQCKRYARLVRRGAGFDLIRNIFAESCQFELLQTVLQQRRDSELILHCFFKIVDRRDILRVQPRQKSIR